MFKKPFSFEGRIRRKEYAISLLLIPIIFFGFSLIIWGISYVFKDIFKNVIEIISVVFSLIILILLPWFWLAQAVKRSHDIGNSGWWLLLVPLYYGLILLVAEGEPRSNKYGEDPKKDERKTVKDPIIEKKEEVTDKVELKEESSEKVTEEREDTTEPSESIDNGEKEYQQALAYYNGEGVEQSFIEAVYYLKQAIEKGYEESKGLLGQCYYAGQGVEQSYGKAVELWEDLAKKGNGAAQYNIALCYYKGKGVESSVDKAMEYLRMACENRVDEACNLLNKIKKENSK